MFFLLLVAKASNLFHIIAAHTENICIVCLIYEWVCSPLEVASSGAPCNFRSCLAAQDQGYNLHICKLFRKCQWGSSAVCVYKTCMCAPSWELWWTTFINSSWISQLTGKKFIMLLPTHQLSLLRAFSTEFRESIENRK